MTKKLLAFPLTFVMVVCVCATAAFAEGNRKSEPGTAIEVKETSAREAGRAKTKLKKDMDQLVAAAKDGKVAPRAQQFPRTARNNLSKTTKIALIASAIGAGIFLAVMFHALSKD